MTKNVQAEISRYKRSNVLKKTLRLDDTLIHWGTSTHLAFSLLQHVGQQPFGNQIERTFGGMGNLLAGRRSGLDAYLVEMLIFLYSNFDSVPNIFPYSLPETSQSSSPGASRV